MASTSTPRGNAAILQPWASYINAAATKYGVPAWLIGAIILHESSGTPGIVNPTSGASGLMQVLPSAHPQYDYARMRGTDAGAIAYQIDSGAAVLAAHIKGAGSVQQGVQNYAGGSAYPGSFLDELTTGYKSAVDIALGSQTGDPGAASGTTGTASTGGFSQSLVDITQFFQRLMQPDTWTRAALIVGGVLVVLVGAGMAVKDTRAGRAVAGTAEKAALAAA